jgi:hypothetical protein
MSTKTLTQRTTDRKRNSPPSGVVADQYIEAQLNRTRRDVKLVDLSGALMVLAAAVLGTLLVLAMIDHWIVPLGALARWGMLAVIAISAGWYFVKAIVPLLLGTVNPIYAARTIELSEPTLNNSLVNYLMFRDDRAGLRTGIYEALKQQAAADLTHVPIDSAVDRTRLIRVGYALAAILALFAAYTIVSPKNPFQTAQRVILPWAEIAPPTRVRIEDVLPGDQQVYFGDRVRVTATCFDLRSDEPVTLFYSSQDGRIRNQSIPLIHTGTGLQYEAMVPQSDEGIAQDLIYRIEAGDAVTASYRLTVQPAPTLLVQQIEYEYPGYTGQPRRVVQRRGDVRGIEGTRVTIRAQANHPIRWATIVLNPPTNSHNGSHDGAAALSGNSGSEMVSMQFDGQQASGTFLLEMHPDKQRPKHTSYLLRFETESGQINTRAPEYRIEVIPDLTPEIEILTPTAPRIELPVDRRQGIEVRAIDPDFGLTNIELQAVAGGEQLLAETLFADVQGRTGQVVKTYQLEPWMLGLRPGDSLTFWATAEDNRVALRTGQPAPNQARTSSVHVTILPAENSATGPQPTPAEPEQHLDDAATTPDAPRPDPADAGDDSPAPGQADPSQESSDDAAEDAPEDTPEDADQSDGSGTSGGEDGDSSSSAGPSSSADGQPGASDSDSSPSGGDMDSGGAEESSPGSERADDSQSSAGSQPSDGREGSSPRAGDSSNDAAAGQDSWDDQPLHDGEVIERALEHIESQKSDGKTEPGSDSPRGESPDSQPSGSQDIDPSGDAPVDDTQAMGEQGLEPATPSPDDMPGEMPDDMPGEMPGDMPGDMPGEMPSDASGDSTDEGGQPDGAKPAESESGQTEGDRSDDSPGGRGDDGQSGAGQDNQDPTGAPAAMEENADRPKDGDADSNADSDLQQTSEETPSPSQSEHQSDSQGEGQGDQSGGGEQGGGQGSQQEGSDSSGSHRPADQGSGAADASGMGDTTPRPGDQQTADAPTGVPGSEQGDGSSAQAREGADGPGAVPEDASEASSGERPAGQPSPSESEKPGPGQPMGGGRPGELDSPHSGAPEGETAAEEPNLQYAARTTDLVLEYLRDQQQNPDPELLERLRWSEDDLRRFLDRWEDLQDKAADDQRGQQQWNDALRSLGLRPDQQGSRRVSAPADSVQGLRDTGAQSRPPGRYLEQFNAFKKGTARVDE